MSCTSCQAALETQGNWPYFDPLCPWCGGRLIAAIGKLPIPPESVIARRRAVLADWMKYGHAEQEIRSLAKLPLAIAPEAAEWKVPRRKGK